MRASLLCVAGAVGMAAVGLASPASADDLNSVVRTLNAVMNPTDAQRYEDQARRNGRPDEERYWYNYRAGLEEQRRGPGDGQAAPAYAGGRIGPEQARAYEEQAHRNGRYEDERYWHNYAAGLEGQRPGWHSETMAPPHRENAEYQQGHIGFEQASRLEEQAHREGRWEDERYWADYRAGLQGR